MPTVNLKNLWRIEMSINTPFNVTLTEGQIGVILCSLEAYYKHYENIAETEVDIQAIFQELEGSVDRFYDNLEKKQSQQPVAEWTD
mgnify:CR=1 FL=1